jgi:hypothetical protein
MRRGLAFGAAAALSILTVAPAPAQFMGVSKFQGTFQFGRPDYSNYLSRPGTVTCNNFAYQNYFRACPTPHPPPKPAAEPTHKSG